jgi:Flp pilus assembly protein TadG
MNHAWRNGEMYRSGHLKDSGAKRPRHGSALWIRNLAKRTAGQSFVEFALILPVFLILVMGILDMARAFSALQMVTNAAREGARVGVMPTSVSSVVIDAVDNYLAAGGQTGCATTGSNWGAAGDTGDSTSVTVSCNFATLTGTIIPVWTGILTLTRTANMRHE